MSDDFKPGLEGVIAFESQIAEPDKEGSALRYRGVDIDDLVGRVTFGNVWGLLVDDQFNPGLPNAKTFPLPVHSGDVRVDVQSAIAMLAPARGFKPLLDISDEEARENLAQTSVMVLSYLAQAARGIVAPAVPDSEIDKAHTVVERMMIRWRGEPDPLHVRAIRLMGFGHRVYRAEDPRARTLRRTAKELNAPRYAVAEALEQAALKELRERQPDRVLETNVEFWAAIILDFAQVPAPLFTSMFTAARTAGWSAHILEQKRTGRLIRPSARYVGKGPRKPEEVDGWDGSVGMLHT